MKVVDVELGRLARLAVLVQRLADEWEAPSQGHLEQDFLCCLDLFRQLHVADELHYPLHHEVDIFEADLKRRIERADEDLTSPEAQGALILANQLKAKTEELVFQMSNLFDNDWAGDSKADLIEFWQEYKEVCEDHKQARLGADLAPSEVLALPARVESMIAKWQESPVSTFVDDLLSKHCGPQCMPLAFHNGEPVGKHLDRLKAEARAAALMVPTAEFNKLLPPAPPLDKATVQAVSTKPECFMCGDTITVQVRFCNDRHPDPICYGCFRRTTWSWQHDEHEPLPAWNPIPCPMCKSEFGLEQACANLQLVLFIPQPEVNFRKIKATRRSPPPECSVSRRESPVRDQSPVRQAASPTPAPAPRVRRVPKPPKPRVPKEQKPEKEIVLDPANGRVCCVCGTEETVQWRKIGDQPACNRCKARETRELRKNGNALVPVHIID